MAQHNSLVGRTLHKPHRFEFADEAARLAEAVTEVDLYHMGLQLDTNTYYLLVSLYPVTWLPLNQVTNTILSGEGEPSDLLGIDSDYYLDVTSHTLYGPKVDGAWPDGVLLKPQVNTILSGVTPPTVEIGSAGDFYLDKVQYKLYGPKTTVWPAGVSLKADVSEIVITTAIAGSYSLNPADGTIFSLTPTEDTKILLGTFATAGLAITVIINQALLPKAISWSDNITWPQGSEPEFLIPNSRCMLTLFSPDGGVTWQGLLVGVDFKESNPEKYRIRTFLNLPAATWRCAETSVQLWNTANPDWATISWISTPVETYLEQAVQHAAAITAGQASGIGFDFTLTSNRDLHFFYKVNTVLGDNFIVKLNGVEQLNINGTLDWTEFRQALAAGAYRLEIGYVKDVASTATGDYCNITWPRLSKMSLWQPNGGSIFVMPGPNAVQFEQVPTYELIPDHYLTVDKHKYVRAEYLKLWTILVNILPGIASWKLRPGGVYSMNDTVPSAQLQWETTAELYQDLAVFKAATITDNQNTGLRVNFSVDTDNSRITFYYKTSSELDCDFLTVYLDNVQIGQYSGAVDWLEFTSNTITAGTHILDFIYSKDGSVSEGEDTAWVTAVKVLSNADFTASGVTLEVKEGPYVIEFSTESGYLPYAPITLNLTENTTLNITYTAE